MRIMYKGMDGRNRVAKAIRVKFLEDGFQNTDPHAERNELVQGPCMIVHIFRNKGGKRLLVEVPFRYDMDRAQTSLLKDGYLDITDCSVKQEFIY